MKFKQQVRRLTNRNWGVSMQYQPLNSVSIYEGWINYFVSPVDISCVELDHWIRRRVRMAYWRQWRKPRTKVRKKSAAAVACWYHHKGPWRVISGDQSSIILITKILYSLRDGDFTILNEIWFQGVVGAGTATFSELLFD